MTQSTSVQIRSLTPNAQVDKLVKSPSLKLGVRCEFESHPGYLFDEFVQKRLKDIPQGSAFLRRCRGGRFQWCRKWNDNAYEYSRGISEGMIKVCGSDARVYVPRSWQ